MNGRWLAGGGFVLLCLFVGIGLALEYGRESVPEPIPDALEHFKYGSIGAEVNGYPFLVWRELPTLFPDELKDGWGSFGFIQESSRPLPVGISVRKYGIERVGFNCATCHTTQVAGKVGTIPGAPADQLDLQRYLRFLIRSSQDSRFNASRVFESAEANQRPFGVLDKLVYRFYIIPKIRSELADHEAGGGTWMKSRPDHGPGRTDAGNPWRVKFGLRPEDDLLSGAVDMPSLWQQRIRQNAWMHWDGNNGSLAERNLSAALAGGATEESLDHRSIERVAAWAMDLPSPKFPQPVSPDLAAQGHALYMNLCASCHAVEGGRFGQVTPLSELHTDPDRVNLFSEKMVASFASVGQGRPWRFHHYRKTHGYANAPLDGIWARAPYLHNGSVPTLHDLLLPPSQRPKRFFKGCQTFDTVKVGRVCEADFSFDASLRGNGNGGHEWGTHLEPAERAALVEYLKTL